MVTETYRGARQWSRNQQAVATVVWVSFLSAAVATMVFFAVYDPVELWMLAAEDSREIPAEAAYAAGFFFFWLLSSLASGLTAWLVRTAPRRQRSDPA